MDTLKSMTPDQRAEAEARVAAHQASKPAAIETDGPAVFTPGTMIFVDGQYRCTSPDTARPWPWVRLHIEGLLSLLPARHRLEYWRERVERGASLLMVFFNSDGREVVAAGLMSLELFDDGRRMAAASILTFSDIDFTDLSAICETIALLSGAQGASIWTPQPVTLCPGWSHEDSISGFLQTIAVEPLQ
jgi:hypothetical protein